jgi:chloramphenicol-sensitive protein RarD
VLYAGLAFTSWGLYPLYFRQVAAVGAVEVLVHRIVWSLLFLVGLLALRRRWAWLGPAFRDRRLLATFAASAVLLSINWMTYIWAVGHGHVVDASLGYFITPLVNVALGYGFLHERLRRPQWVALALAFTGVAWLTVQAGQLPWIGLTLASSFGVYGLLRKVATLGALEALTFETMLLLPPALVAWWWLATHGTASFGQKSMADDLWLVGIGPVTAIPLLFFGAGARRLRLVTIGILQYVSPSLQFMLGVWVFHEAFSQTRLVGFALIWAALALYTADAWRASRRMQVAVAYK